MTLYYDENGKEYDVEPLVKVVAKKSINKQDKLELYHILCKSGQLYKLDLNLRDKQKDGWRFIQVNQETFNYYYLYLTKHDEFVYYKAQRQI